MANIFTEKIYINQIYFQVTYWVPTLSAYYSANAFIYFYMFYKEPNNSTWYTTNSLYLLLYIFTDLFKYNENTGNCTDLKSTIWEVFIHIHTCEAIPAVRMMETPTSCKSCLCFCRLLSHPRQPLICHYIGFYILKMLFTWTETMLFWGGLVSYQGFPGSSTGKESACNAGDLGLIPGLGRSPGEGNGHPLQYSGLENSMDRGAWQATAHGVAKIQRWLSDFQFSYSYNYHIYVETHSYSCMYL